MSQIRICYDIINCVIRLTYLSPACIPFLTASFYLHSPSISSSLSLSLSLRISYYTKTLTYSFLSYCNGFCLSPILFNSFICLLLPSPFISLSVQSNPFFHFLFIHSIRLVSLPSAPISLKKILLFSLNSIFPFTFIPPLGIWRMPLRDFS